ncbi:MAG: hypothetical protein K0R82_35 [Flavipsychrobacter sp.]|jgi:hypothetical protein|nr:hypothetical protein [Flavipsychrobacter sp.]
MWERYEDKTGNGGVAAFELLLQGIILEFKDDGRQYLYSYKKPGKTHVDQMKLLAQAGAGLTTYVNQHVRENYERRLK